MSRILVCIFWKLRSVTTKNGVRAQLVANESFPDREGPIGVDFYFHVINIGYAIAATGAVPAAGC
jgi:hypothetical protein